MTKNIIITKIITMLLLLGYCKMTAQQEESRYKVINEYIKIGLKNNLALQQKLFNLEKSHLALQEARGYYLPTVTFQSDYSMTKGGSTIDLPLGDLLNNVYASLNQLTASNNFKMLQNQKIALMEPKFQNTRIQTVVPIINPAINYINRIKKEAIVEKQAEATIFKRELIRDIQVAYFNYLQVQKFMEIYKNANQLLVDNIRYTEALIANGKGLKSSLLKVQVQLAKNTANLFEAENKSKAAAAYFNFLINSPLESAIVIASEIDNTNSWVHINAGTGNRTGREELVLLQSLIKQSDLIIKKEKSAWLPQISAFLDAGTQGSTFNMNKENRYLLGGTQLKWTIYNGSKTSNKAKQARMDLQILQLELNETTQQLKVENNNTKLELKSAFSKLAASKSNQQLAAEIYRETQLRYRQNQALSIELLDAFTQLINSQLELELNQIEILLKHAEVERATASYIL